MNKLGKDKSIKIS